MVVLCLVAGLGGLLGGFPAAQAADAYAVVGSFDNSATSGTYQVTGYYNPADPSVSWPTAPTPGASAMNVRFVHTIKPGGYGVLLGGACDGVVQGQSNSSLGSAGASIDETKVMTIPTCPAGETPQFAAWGYGTSTGQTSYLSDPSQLTLISIVVSPFVYPFVPPGYLNNSTTSGRYAVTGYYDSANPTVSSPTPVVGPGGLMNIRFVHTVKSGGYGLLIGTACSGVVQGQVTSVSGSPGQTLDQVAQASAPSCPAGQIPQFAAWAYGGSTGTTAYTDPHELTLIPVSIGGDWWDASGGGALSTKDSLCPCGDPVSSRSGELYETIIDLSLPGRAGIDSTRTYSSTKIGTEGLLGWGWTTPWESHVVAAPDLSWAAVVQENSSTVTFPGDGTGSFTAPEGVFATLTRDASSGAWSFVRALDNSFGFDADGRLSSITDRNGESTSLAWTDTDLTIDAADGRQLSYELNAAGRATSLSGPGGRTVGFHRDTDGNLDTVTDARGFDWTYGYDSAHRMTSLTTPLQESTVTHYDAYGRVDSQTNPRQGVTSFSYDLSYTTATTRVTDPAGVVTDYAYESGRLTSRTVDPQGSAATWRTSYDTAGNPVGTEDPTGAATSATFDDHGNALTRTDTADHTTTFTYNAFNEPLTQLDPAGHTSSWTYDGNGNMLTAVVPVGTGASATTTVVRGATHPGDVASVTDPDNRMTSFGYTPEGFVASRTTGDTAETSWTYNPYGQPKTEVSPRGNATGGTPAQYTTGYTYDDGGNRTLVTDPLGHTTGFGYDDDSRPTSVTDAYTKTTTTEYFDDGTVKSVTDPLARRTSHSYDLAGKPLSTTAADNGVTSTEYESHGWPMSVTKPTGNAAGVTTAEKAARTVTTGYNLAGQVTTVSQPDPVTGGATLTTATVYDSAGRVWKVTNPAGERTQYLYDSLNRVDTVTDPRDKVTSYTYDWAGRRTDITDPLGHTTHTTYSPAGLVAAERNPASETTQYGYDPAGRVKTVIDPRGTCAGCTAANYTTTYGYDLDGDRTGVTDQLGHTTGTVYDRAGRVTSVTDANTHHRDYTYDDADRLKTVTAPDLGVTTYGYDDAGQRTSTQNPRLKTFSYTYDPVGRPASATDPLAHTTSRTYTLDGQPKKIVTARGNAGTPADGTITYTYDDTGRLTGTAYGDGATPVTYGYDKASRPTSMTDAAGTQTRGYDPAGRLTSLTRGTSTWTYGYYDDGTVKTRTRPDTTVETWTYDTAARPTQVVAPAGTTTFTVDKAGNLTSSAHPNATTETQTWDRAGYLATVVTKKGAATLVSQAVTRDSVNNPTQTVINRGNKTETRSYRYDANDRLQGVCYVALSSCTGASAATQWWTYDPDGNRVTEKNGTGTGTTTTYTNNDADQLTSRKVGTATAVPLSYDPDGNALTDGTLTWTYDLNNRTTSSKIGTTTTGWQRDGEGNLVKQTTGSTVTNYGWDLNNTVPRLATSTTGTTTTSYRYDPAGRPASLTQGTVTETIAHDPLGSVTDLITSTGSIARSYDYTPFGIARTAIGAPNSPTGPTSPLQYAAMLTSGANSTYTTRDRTYDPATARWSSIDPLSHESTDPFDSSYTYVGNQPTVMIDPLGDTFGWVNSAINVGVRGLDLANRYVNPMSPLVEGYRKEIQAFNSGCGYWNAVGYGVRGTLHSTVLVAAMAVGAPEAVLGKAAAETGDMAAVRAAGQAGEKAAGIVRNTGRIPSSTGSAAYRIPDELGNGVLGEVKNVKSLSYSSQLQDFVSYAQANGLRFNLYVRESTTFSGPLQKLIDTGVINRVPSLGP
jgi:RHS repeat-associated protein